MFQSIWLMLALSLWFRGKENQDWWIAEVYWGEVVYIGVRKRRIKRVSKVRQDEAFAGVHDIQHRSQGRFSLVMNIYQKVVSSCIYVLNCCVSFNNW